MTKKRAKSKKEGKKSFRSSREDQEKNVKTSSQGKEGTETHGSPCGSKHKHEHSLVRDDHKQVRGTGYRTTHRERSPKNEAYKKSYGKYKPATFTGSSEVSKDSEHRELHGSMKHSSSEHYGSTEKTEKRSSRHGSTSSVPKASSKDLDRQMKKQVKMRFAPEEPKQRLAEVAFLSEEKRKMLKKRRSWSDEDCPVAKRRDAKKQADVGRAHEKSETKEWRQKRVDQMERRDREDGAVEKHKGNSSPPARTPSSVVTPKAKMKSNDRQQEHTNSKHCSTSGEARSSYPCSLVTFKIPKKSCAVKTSTDIWERDNGNKTHAVISKRSITFRLSENVTPKQNKLKPEEVSSQSPVYTTTQKVLHFPEVQVKKPSPLKESTPVLTEHAISHHDATKHVQTFNTDHEMQLVEELHQARNDRRLQVNVVKSYGELTCMDVDPPEEATTVGTSQQQREQDLLLVLDTNVLLSHLDFVKKIRSNGLGGLGFPTLLIPWVVLQELDALKSGKLSREVERKAQPAVHFIYSCLKGQEPRLWGQSMQQASQAACGLDFENNDDRVLQCCLQYQNLYPDGTLILCTNDKNLCSKALLSGVKALSKADLVQQSEINPGFLGSQHIACVPAESSKKEEQRGKPSEEEEEAMQRKASAERELSKCVSALESSLQKALSAVLEEEMKAAFGELWTEVVYVKPPWTLEAVLKCFRKHWIAVFGIIIRRNLLSCVETLSNSLCSGVTVDRASLLTAVHVAWELLTELSKRSAYGGHVRPALSCLKNLQHRLQAQSPKPLVEADSDTDALMSDAVEDEAPVSHQEVWALFESIWSNVCQVSSALFATLRYSPGSADIVQPSTTPPSQDALSCLHQLSSALQQLLEAFQRILSMNSTIEDTQALLDFIHTSKIAAVDPNFTAKDLFDCLSQQEYREKLSVGGSQLMELRMNLDRCASAVLC